MCGILGIIGTRWRDQAESILDSLRRRGPDEQRLYADRDMVFGHTRLAVIDLAGGHQPMRTADGRFTIVFNGEIYNAAELRTGLEGLGARFVTGHSDTEVLLQGFRVWGNGLLERLDGMFAFAIWDSLERRLFAARDRLGIKPLMYAAHEDGLVFASTLAPFLAIKGFPKRLDPEALRDYLAFQTPLAPQTFLSSVRQLPPAHWLDFHPATNRLEIRQWWSIPGPMEAVQDASALLERIDAALAESVRRQMISDVPLGAFLSGGIDSSLIVRYMAGASSRPIETFSLRFPDEGFDESRHAAAVAECFGCHHHLLDLPEIDGDGFAASIRELDQPLADPAYVMTHGLARLTRQHVTVALSGDGGDELFGGYPRFLETEDLFPARAWQKPMRALIDAGLLPPALIRRTLSGPEMVRYRRVEVGPWPGRKNLAQYLSPETNTAAHPERTLGLWSDLIARLGGRMDSATLMRADLWTYLSENCLTKTDRSSMAHGLEVRVPILGQPVLDTVLTLPAQVHLAGGTKRLLTALARRHLPKSVWDRPKHGFSVPLQRLMFRGPWREACREALESTRRLAPFLNAPAVEALGRKAAAGRASRRLAYTFVVLLLWLEGKGIEP